MVKRDIEFRPTKAFQWSDFYSDGIHRVLDEKHPYFGSTVEIVRGRLIRVVTVEPTCAQCNPSSTGHGKIW